MQSLISRVRAVPMLIGLFAFTAVAPLQAVAIADQTFTFTGNCTDCSGVAKATLVLQNYTLGENILLEHLVSFTYLATNLLPGFTLVPSNTAGISGSIPAGLPGPAQFGIFGGETFSIQNLTGANGADININEFNAGTLPFFITYLVNQGPDALHGNTVYNWEAGLNVVGDYGTDGTWNVQSEVPEPSSVILIGVGLLAIGFRRFKR